MDQARHVKTNSLNIGMNKDVDPLFISDGQYLNAINAKLNSHQGDFSLIQNEPSNFSCLSLRYDFIGSIPLPGGKYAIFSTTDFFSEIGIFNEEDCSYKTVINNSCLNFKKEFLITGRAKENFDCTTSIYWTDGYNPRRYLNLDKLPYKYTVANDKCQTKQFTDEVDCQSLLIQPVITYPNVSIALGTDGNVRNGSYQAAIAYSINGQRVTDPMSITQPVQIFSHENFGRSLEISLSNLDQDFDEYQLIIIHTIDGVVGVDNIGTYSTSQTKVIVTSAGPTAVNNKVLTLDEVTTPSVIYEKADDVVSTSEFLIWTNPTTKTELDYQKLANKITSKWVAYKVSSDYYKKGGNKRGYMRDEVYSFAIQWLYDTGDWTPAYHIPGRRADSSDTDYVSNFDAYESRDPDYTGKTRPQMWNVYNTAYQLPNEYQDIDKRVIAEGRMGYWESSERYADNAATYGDLNCEPIRHHRFPDNATSFMTTAPETGEEEIVILGVRFEDIQVPLDSEGIPRKDIVGYRIVRGDRFGNESITGKGILFNVGSYKDEVGDEVLYPNYPLNDLRRDPFLSATPTKSSGSRETGYTAFGSFKRDSFTLHSPEFSFNNPGIGSELKIEGEVIADVKGRFEQVYKHPRHKMITNFAAGVATLIGVAEGYLAIKGRTCVADEYKAKLTVIIPGVEYNRTVSSCSTALSMKGIIPFAGLVTGLIGGALAFGYYFNEGVDAALKVIKTFGAFQQYAYQYNAHAFYNRFDLPKLGNTRRRILHGQYLIPGAQHANAKKINNIQRESSVYIQVDSQIENPTNIDTSRRTMTEFGICGKDLTYVRSSASSYYASVKKSISNQYGQLESINYLDTGDPVQYIDHKELKVKSTPVFGGDTFITRFSVKRKMSYFNQTLFDVQDGAELNYKNYYNIPYPRFWINTEEYDASEVRTLKLASSMHNFDCRNQEKLEFIIKKRVFYLYNSAIADFYVESKYNLENRDWDDTINGKHYDRFVYTDYSDLLRSDRINYDNKFIFNTGSYLKQLNEVFIPKQSRNFDPTIAAECYTKFKNRVIYSSPATKEQIKDNWRVYLPNNYYDFSKENGDLVSVKSFGNDRLIFLFDKSSPFVTMGVDTLQTDGGIKVTLGDGGVFDRRPQRLVYTDFSYGNSQSRWAYLNTPYGGFYPSQRQGKVFMFNGEHIEDIGMSGLSWWFNINLPSKLLAQFPDFRHKDNPINGVSVISVYDNTDATYYLSKIDYRIKPEWLPRSRYDAELDKFFVGNTEVKFKDPFFFDNCSWTVSYDVKRKSWISFHDWYPEWTFQTEGHFLTYKNRKLWKHNESCNSFCNFYGIDHPFEIEFSVSNGQNTSTLSSLEWNLECQKYFNNCYDSFHSLEDNFDQMIVYNSEQNSGTLRLNPRGREMSSIYPIIWNSKIDIAYSKKEQKYRVNQFWDITRDRGQFTGKQIQMWETQPNGYRKILNRQFLDYNKDQFQHKKFRHNYHKIILRKTISKDIKMIFKFNNTKQIASFR